MATTRRSNVVGVAWPNPGCPVMMVECEDGMEERSLGGQINLARTPAQNPGAAQGSSYFNRQEAILAIRHVPPPHTVAD